MSGVGPMPCESFFVEGGLCLCFCQLNWISELVSLKGSVMSSSKCLWVWYGFGQAVC